MSRLSYLVALLTAGLAIAAPHVDFTKRTVANPFTKPLFANDFYASEVAGSVKTLQNAGNSALAAKAATVASIPTFYWLDTAAKVPTMAAILKAAGAANQIAQFVVYDLPDRDCAAAASNGEYSIANNGQANYFAYVDAIKAQLAAYPSTSVILVVEPDSLPNLVTNLNVQKCSNAQTTYITCVEYALKTLNLPNVAMYVDAGHAGWLGWQSNIQPAANLFAQVYKAAGSPAAVRGLATNTANYNAFDNGGHPDPITQGDPDTDEAQYVASMAPLLTSAGFPANFIVDTSRNGVQNLRTAWGDWCNVKGAGLGIRPTTSTGTSLVDAFVWVKPPGECDGTSNTSAARYDFHCGQSDAAQPAPEAGAWFEAYFETLVANANPPLGSSSSPPPTSITTQPPTTTNKPPTTTSTPTSTPPTTTSTPPSTSCAAKYAQCGGQGWAGATCCAAGSTCKVSNPYYSQCL